MCRSATQCAERVADRENLVRELCKKMEILLATAECVKCQADNSGRTPYSDWSSAVDDLRKVSADCRSTLARAKDQQGE